MTRGLDVILCTLSSLGQTIADLTTTEDLPHRRDCIADLGRLVFEKANQGLELLDDPGEQAVDSNGS